MTMLATVTAGAIALLPAPSVFAPGEISGPAHDSAPAFAPDERTVLFGRSTSAAAFILESKRRTVGWSPPKIASFSGRWMDMEPAMAPTGAYLIFASNRPARGDGRPLDGVDGVKMQPGMGSNLWRVDRTSSGWSAAARLPDVINQGTMVFSPSIAANGNLYFMRPSGDKQRFSLFVSRLSANGYGTPEALPFSDGSVTDVDPAVAPDESFIVFGSGRHNHSDIDLFISFQRTGVWSVPAYLGDKVNSPGSDAEPRLGADRHTLYFSSDRIVPVAKPMTSSSAGKALSIMSSYNNGLYNIWQVDLAPVLRAPF